jgi:two-component system, NarL family, sensor histidine kinase DevS
MDDVGDAQRTRAKLESTVDGLDETIRELRMAVFSHQGEAAAPGGLPVRLLRVVTEATDGLGFEPRLQFDGPVELIEVRIADHLTPVLREALSNIAHHARAGLVRVAVSVAEDVTTLRVSDDGIGVPLRSSVVEGSPTWPNGPRKLGGDVTISPHTSGGPVLVWQVPIQRTPQPA